MPWDIFICHASEDKGAIATPLAEALSQAGLCVWYDEFALTLGDNLRRSIDRGIRESRYGIAILSPHFFAKEWTQIELDELFTREVEVDKVILPVWHGVTYHDVAQHSLRLANKVAISTDQGLAHVVQAILRVVIPKTFSGIGDDFVLIPSGEFMMGAHDNSAFTNEQPVHRVQISRPFYLGKYPVTQALWQSVIGNNPSKFKGDPLRPVEQVSWNDTQEFIRKLNEQEGGIKYRLPTEAEWEYACRAGSTTMYSFGDDPRHLGEYAWYTDDSEDKTHPVGQRKPNKWGLYDMHGNVYEWLQDWYSSEYYSQSPPQDPQGPSSGATRALRGGAWRWAAKYCRSADRGRWHPYYRSDDLGFRLLRTAP